MTEDRDERPEWPAPTDDTMASVAAHVFEVLRAVIAAAPREPDPTGFDSAASVVGSEGLEVRKYHTLRLDGTDAPGGKHHDCPLFVLDLRHDPAAVVALAAYAAAVARSNPVLAADLVARYLD